MIDTGLRGRVTLVIGATEGVGRAASRIFASQGAWIAVNFRTDLGGAKSLVDEIRCEGGRALLVPGDTRTAEGAWAVARYVEDEWEQVDVLLHAGNMAGPNEDVHDPMPLVWELAPGMRARRWGRVVVFEAVNLAGRSDLQPEWAAHGILANTLRVPVPTRPECIEETARCALFFGSGWNSGIAGARISICGT